MGARVAIIGWAWSPFVGEHDAALDELVFDVAYRALRDAGVHKGDVGLSAMASMDLFEARTISNGMTTPASAGYLSHHEYRVENDGAFALQSAASAIRGNEVEVAIVTGFHQPEFSSSDASAASEFMNGISRLTFDPHFLRPVGTNWVQVLGLHAAAAVASGRTTTEKLAQIAADEISRGGGERAYRSAPRDASGLAVAEPVAWPLTAAMLPALCSGAISVVLASERRSRRCRQVHGYVTGYGSASNRYVADGAWLSDAGAATRRAFDHAYRQADIGDAGGQIAVAELTALTPALLPDVLGGTGLGDSFPDERLNPSGGARVTYPGFANGLLRLVEATRWLQDHADPGDHAAVHTVEHLTGTIAANATALVVEAV